MIEVGNIVFRKYSENKISRVDYASIGIVLDTHEQYGYRPQYKVAFHGHPAAWFECRNLHRIQEDNKE